MQYDCKHVDGWKKTVNTLIRNSCLDLSAAILLSLSVPNSSYIFFGGFHRNPGAGDLGLRWDKEILFESVVIFVSRSCCSSDSWLYHGAGALGLRWEKWDIFGEAHLKNLASTFLCIRDRNVPTKRRKDVSHSDSVKGNCRQNVLGTELWTFRTSWMNLCQSVFMKKRERKL